MEGCVVSKTTKSVYVTEALPARSFTFAVTDKVAVSSIDDKSIVPEN